MVRNTIIFTFFLFALGLYLASPSAHAQVKDSFYFMKDDGVFSDEEKDEEAEYIHTKCTQGTFQKIYYDCECLAGAFRAERDSEKLMPQDTILQKLYEDKGLGCINTASIAGDTYEFCTSYAQSFRSRKNNNEEFCGCVANTAAEDFKENPVMRLPNIEKIRSNALVSCGRTYK